MNLIKYRNTIIKPAPTKIMYCYDTWQESFEKAKLEFPEIEFFEGLPSNYEFNKNETNLIILDDLMNECSADENVLNLFTKWSHHRNASVIFISQNVFSKGKHSRTISLNSHYMVLFNNPRDRSQISHIGRQMFPGNSKFFEEAFFDATNKPHGYILVDLTQETPEDQRIQSSILPNEGNLRCIYVKK